MFFHGAVMISFMIMKQRCYNISEKPQVRLWHSRISSSSSIST